MPHQVLSECKNANLKIEMNNFYLPVCRRYEQPCLRQQEHVRSDKEGVELGQEDAEGLRVHAGNRGENLACIMIIDC